MITYCFFAHTLCSSAVAHLLGPEVADTIHLVLLERDAVPTTGTAKQNTQSAVLVSSCWDQR